MNHNSPSINLSAENRKNFHIILHKRKRFQKKPNSVIKNSNSSKVLISYPIERRDFPDAYLTYFAQFQFSLLALLR